MCIEHPLNGCFRREYLAIKVRAHGHEGSLERTRSEESSSGQRTVSASQIWARRADHWGHKEAWLPPRKQTANLGILPCGRRWERDEIQYLGSQKGVAAPQSQQPPLINPSLVKQAGVQGRGKNWGLLKAQLPPRTSSRPCTKKQGKEEGREEFWGHEKTGFPPEEKPALKCLSLCLNELADRQGGQERVDNMVHPMGPLFNIPPARCRWGVTGREKKERRKEGKKIGKLRK